MNQKYIGFVIEQKKRIMWSEHNNMDDIILLYKFTVTQN
jgi:hypothetical protein